MTSSAPAASPTLHLICGLPGSGKTTLAGHLEAELPAVRLSPDEWLIRLGSDSADEAKRTTVEALQMDLAFRLLQLGLNVVLENGFWTRSERETVRGRATNLGFPTMVHSLDVPREELIRRLRRRNAALPPDTFAVTEAQLDAWLHWWEPPSADEQDEYLKSAAGLLQAADLVKESRLVPELDVTDLEASLEFYTRVIGFTILYQRPEDRFAYLDLEGANLMLEQASGPGRRFRTAPVQRPFGRGMNLQIAVSDIDVLHARVLVAGSEVVIPVEQRIYRIDAESVRQKQFVVADPDGYLLRFFQPLD